MGDRVSVRFQLGTEQSVTLFSHWGGREFADEAKRYADALMAEREGHVAPLDRFEPGTVMVDFIRHVTKGEPRVTSNLYLGATPEDGDDSDNGCFVIVLDPAEREVRVRRSS